MSHLSPQQVFSTGGLLKNFPCWTSVDCRTLYAPATLGIDSFRLVQEKIRTQFTNMTDRFRKKMTEFSDESSTNMIFTEDLKNMIHLAENRKDDLDLVQKMVMKFYRNNKEMRFGNYVFGPVLMRMYYCMNVVEDPLKLFKNPDLEGFFNQVLSYQILMDMLYEQKQYQDVLDLYSSCKAPNLEGSRHLVMLVMAACYQLNTPESLKYAMNVRSNMTQAGKEPMRKASTFIAGLALKQNNPGMALEVTSTIRQQTYMTVKNIKILALTRVSRFEEVLVHLKGVIEMEVNTDKGTRQSISKEVLDELLKTLEAGDSKDVLSDTQRICKLLHDHGHVTQKSLNDLLTMEVVATETNVPRRTDKSVLAGSFRSNQNQRHRSGNNPRFTRPGLAELN
ncbi:pentatricopeptide repeat-containing protein 2, mitochondrial [Sergentomyia squamirostris]